MIAKPRDLGGLVACTQRRRRRSRRGGRPSASLRGAGTRQEPGPRQDAGDVVQTGLRTRERPLPMIGIVAVLRPLPVGPHTVDIFVTMSADHWDGFGHGVTGA